MNAFIRNPYLLKANWQIFSRVLNKMCTNGAIVHRLSLH